MKSAFSPSDLTQALALLTRLPLPAFLPAPDPARSMAQAAWAWPLVGALAGVLAALVAMLALWLGTPPLIAAALAVLLQLALTGALHEDGLADCADGFWGGADKARRLEIMHDSRVGSYGVAALTLSLLLRIAAIASLAQAGWLLAPLIATGALSRAPMALMSAALAPARPDGLSRRAGQPSRAVVQAGLAIALGLALLTCGLGAAFWAVLWIGAVLAGLAALANRKIGGQTGDVLGASQQLAEIAALTTFASLAG